MWWFGDQIRQQVSTNVKDCFRVWGARLLRNENLSLTLWHAVLKLKDTSMSMLSWYDSLVRDITGGNSLQVYHFPILPNMLLAVLPISRGLLENQNIGGFGRSRRRWRRRQSRTRERERLRRGGVGGGGCVRSLGWMGRWNAWPLGAPLTASRVMASPTSEPSEGRCRAEQMRWEAMAHEDWTRVIRRRQVPTLRRADGAPNFFSNRY